MASFSVKHFYENPSIDKLRDKVIKEDEWKCIAAYFKIEYTQTMTKEYLKNTVIEELVKIGILPDEAIDEFAPVSTSIVGIDDKAKSVSASSVVSKGDWSAERLEFEKNETRV